MESGIIPGDSYEPHSSVIEATRDIREDGAGFQIITASPSRRVWSLGHDFIVKEWLCPHDTTGPSRRAPRACCGTGASTFPCPR